VGRPLQLAIVLAACLPFVALALVVVGVGVVADAVRGA
jgi:hypothetical protein